MSGERMHQIGEVAERVGLSLRTVRYYEEAGLARPSRRSNGGFRLYGEDDIARLELIKRMKPLGLTLKQMSELLTARDQVREGDPEDPAYDRARERLAGFAELARRRCAELHDEIELAERFSGELQEDLRRPRARSSGAA
jgi:DNA-binding transcriptional MerR regulator